MKRSKQTGQSKKRLVLEPQKIRELSKDELDVAVGGAKAEMTHEGMVCTF